jgi:hypothetical protein
MTQDELKLVLEALKEAQTNDDGMEKWDRNKKAIAVVEKALAQPERKPLTEQRIWEIKLKSHQKFMSRKWVEETDMCSGHYEDVERHTDSPVTFARAIEAEHSIKE